MPGHGCREPKGLASGLVLRFVLRRLAVSVAMVAVSSVLVFVLVVRVGDPVAGLVFDPDIPASAIAERRQQLGLDDPIASRYLRWAAGAARGDLGESLDGRPVRALLWERLQVTLRMVVVGLAASAVAAVGVGAWAARRPYTWKDNLATTLSLVVLSLPVFWLGGLLKEYAAFRLNNLLGARVVATLGEADPNLTGGLLARVGNYASHLVLPTAALAAVLIAAWSRYVRASMIEELSRDHIRAARARGVPERRLTFHHALPNVLGPFANVAAVGFGQVLGGAVVLEQVFGWQGMGDLLLDGVFGPDVNVVLAWLLVAGVLVVAANLAAEVLHARLDPRVRRG